MKFLRCEVTQPHGFAHASYIAFTISLIVSAVSSFLGLSFQPENVETKCFGAVRDSAPSLCADVSLTSQK